MDDRFDTSKDPRFRAVPRHVRKVQVDKRFAHMFKDKRFVETPKVDARGGKLKKDAGRSQLRKFYALAEEKDVAHTGDNAAEGEGDTEAAGAPPGEDAEEAEEEDEDGEAEEAEEDDEDEDEDDEEEDEGAVAEAEEEAATWGRDESKVPRGDASRRLAVMGCDWDRVMAADLLVMFRTYLSSKESQKSGGTLRATGSVNKVTVYPSDFGIEKMAQEALSGPQIEEEFEPDKGTQKAAVSFKVGHDDEEEDEGAQSEALRRYQLQRTKYYWALAECDSVATAAWLYDQMDGLEADGIAPGMLDLRFVPDDLKPPHPPAGEASEVPRKYTAPVQLKSASGHSKVKCTWDETPQQRKKDLMKKSFSAKELKEMDLSAYLASSSGEESEGNADALKKLARGGDDAGDDDSDFFGSGGGSEDEDGKEELGDMEATFSIKAEQLEEQLTERTKKGGKGVHTLEADEPKSVWEQFLQKKKDARKERRKKARDERKARRSGEATGGADAQKQDDDDEAGSEGGGDDGAGDLAVLVEGHDEEEGRGFNLRGPQRAAHRGATGKRKKAAQADGSGVADFKVNTDDPRIAAVFSSADFEIDPTNPEFRRTDGMGAVLRKKRQRKVDRDRGASSQKSVAAASSSSAGAAASASSGGADTETVARGGGRERGGLGGLRLFGGGGGGGSGDAAATGASSASSKKANAAPAEAATVADAIAGERKRAGKRKRKASA